MEVPRGFTPCDECKGGGAVSGFPDTPWEQCPSCSGSGLRPTEELRGDVAVTLRGMIDDRAPARTFTEVAGAVLAKVAEHIRGGDVDV